MRNNRAEQLVQALGLAIVLYLALCLLIQALRCPDLAGRELLNHLEQVARLRFIDC